jgi:hypothetical protein
LVVVAAVGCEPKDRTIPTAEQVESYYETSSQLTVVLNGNVAEVTVQQPSDQLRRGGALWARVGPYIFLFSQATRDLLDEHEGLAGVRVITSGPAQAEVARALLRRDELNSVDWRRALSLAGRARVEGTQRVSLIEELVRWGEAHTTFEYNPAFVP